MIRAPTENFRQKIVLKKGLEERNFFFHLQVFTSMTVNKQEYVFNTPNVLKKNSKLKLSSLCDFKKEIVYWI